MATIKQESIIVCPECLAFDGDFAPGLKEGDACPYCLDVQFKLKRMERREFLKQIAKKIITEML